MITERGETGTRCPWHRRACLHPGPRRPGRAGGPPGASRTLSFWCLQPASCGLREHKPGCPVSDRMVVQGLGRRVRGGGVPSRVPRAASLCGVVGGQMWVIKRPVSCSEASDTASHCDPRPMESPPVFPQAQTSSGQHVQPPARGCCPSRRVECVLGACGGRESSLGVCPRGWGGLLGLRSGCFLLGAPGHSPFF